MKARLSIDPRLISLLGRKQYTGNEVTIAVRELLQNAQDACIRAKVEPQIHIEVSYSDLNREAIVICEDNGCGMTDEEINNYFLCMGGSSKENTQETGRFGVGVGIVLCADYWHLASREFEVDKESAMTEGEIVLAQTPRQGTVVTAHYKEVSFYDFHTATTAMIAFSDVDIDFVLRKNGHIYIRDEHAGLRAEKIELGQGSCWRGYGLPPVTIGTSENGRSFQGESYVRLNGLVQFRKYVYGGSMEGNLIVDLVSHLSPDDKKFPMVMSREKLSGEVDAEVEKWISSRYENSATTDREIKRGIETDEIRFVPGKVLRGKRNPKGDIESSLEDMRSKDNSTAEVVREWIRNAISMIQEENSDLSDYINDKSGVPLMRLMNYEPNPDDVERDTKVLLAWAAILEEILLEGQQFAVGLTSEPNLVAEIKQVSGINFFCINPREIPIQPSSEALVLSLWTKAVHEAAHESGNGHNEKHGATMDYLFECTASPVFKNIPRISKILGGQR